jgi:hypothetical protein
VHPVRLVCGAFDNGVQEDDVVASLQDVHAVRSQAG